MDSLALQAIDSGKRSYFDSQTTWRFLRCLEVHTVSPVSAKRSRVASQRRHGIYSRDLGGVSFAARSVLSARMTPQSPGRFRALEPGPLKFMRVRGKDITFAGPMSAEERNANVRRVPVNEHPLFLEEMSTRATIVLHHQTDRGEVGNAVDGLARFSAHSFDFGGRPWHGAFGSASTGGARRLPHDDALHTF
jgi:hypothetical protein